MVVTKVDSGVFFNKDTDTIDLHLKDIFLSGEMEESSTTEFFSVVQIEGNRKVSRKTRIIQKV